MQYTKLGWIHVEPKVKNNEEDNEIIRKQIAEILKKYFEEEIIEFDKWYETSLTHINDHKKCLTVGQAQKIINMAFKYLYCCKDYRDAYTYKSYFKKCHMPLDSYTLGWFKEIDKGEVYKGEAWSSIDNYEDYINIQERIRKKLKDKNVLEEEFIIWSQEKIKSDLKELRAIKKRCEGNDYFKEILSKDKELIEWLKNLVGSNQ